jgi:hypothetical protein
MARRVTFSLEGFTRADAAFVESTLLAWRAAGVAWERTDAGDADVEVRLAPAREMAARFPQHSLRGLSVTDTRDGAPARVYVHATNWRRVPPASEFRSLAAYRRAVVLHETGHALGLPHARCPAEGAPAPTMMQPSKPLAGCVASGELTLNAAELRAARAAAHEAADRRRG